MPKKKPRRKPKKKSPSASTIDYLQGLGVPVDRVERWIPGANKRKDLFNCIDLVSMSRVDTIGIQVTSMQGISEHIRKIKQIPEARLWASSPFRKLEVHGWAMRGPRGEKRWTGKIVGMRYLPDTKRWVTQENPTQMFLT